MTTILKLQKNLMHCFAYNYISIFFHLKKYAKLPTIQHIYQISLNWKENFDSFRKLVLYYQFKLKNCFVWPFFSKLKVYFHSCIYVYCFHFYFGLEVIEETILSVFSIFRLVRRIFTILKWSTFRINVLYSAFCWHGIFSIKTMLSFMFFTYVHS